MNWDAVIDIALDIFYYPFRKVLYLIWYGIVLTLGVALLIIIYFLYMVVWPIIFLIVLVFYSALIFMILTAAMDRLEGPGYDRSILYISIFLSFFAAWHATNLIRHRINGPYPLYRNIVDKASQLRPTSYSSKRAQHHKRRRL